MMTPEQFNAVWKPAPPITGDEVADIRKAVGLSQPQLATLLGCSASKVRSWEQGVNPDVTGADLLILNMLDLHGLDYVLTGIKPGEGE